MLTKTKKQGAALLKATPKNNQYNTKYHNSLDRSSRKIREKLSEEISELLIYLRNPLSQAEQQQCWQLFESSLRTYLELKICGGTVL